MKVVLINPVIPPNTGNIARTCIANDIPLILVGKIGFSLTESSLRRAGLDYWKYVKLEIYKDFDDFLKSEKPNLDDLLFFSTKGEKYFWYAPYKTNSYLIFGSETQGFPQDFYTKFKEKMYKIPMKSSIVRSLNLATSCGIVIYHAIYKTEVDR
jgi:tRNA (cytidine/uridine-2'-O-)-methyltransferase